MAKRVGEREIFKTKLFSIKDIDIEFSTGKKVTYQLVEKRDTALLIPINSNNEVIFVKEYFYAIDEVQLGLPKGRVEEGDDALKTANKELQEEVGYKAHKLDFLGTYTMAPGYYTQKTHMYLARDLEVSKLEGDEEEKLEVFRYPFDKFEELIEQKKLTEARMIAALFLARRFLEKENS